VPDVFTTEKRSEVMSRIRGRGNKTTELAFRALLRESGISGWRRHYPIFGRPDFVFRKQRIAVFVDGCFWHRCPQCSNMPANNRAFWERKLRANAQRDRLVTKRLRQQGWTVVRVWEHSIRSAGSALRNLRSALGRT
jgi:DNA mismatch endonuclease (patch repair protein)